MNKVVKKIKGFTLIELAIVIVIIGILASIAAVVFSDITDEAEASAADQSMSAVRTAWAVSYATNSAAPSVDTLAAQVQQTGTEASAAADGSGVAVVINGTTYTVATFTDDDCTAADATDAGADVVLCIGDVS